MNMDTPRDSLIALTAAIVLGLIWMQVYRPEKFRRVAATIVSTVALLSGTVMFLMWFGMNYLLQDTR